MKLSRVIFFSSALTALCLFAQPHFEVELKDSSSLVRVGMDPHPTDSADIALAYTLLGAIDHNFQDSIAFVRNAWLNKANENLTKDKAYSSLAYILSRYLGDTPAENNSKLESLLTDDLYSYFTDNDFEHLKHYLTLKYELNNYRPRSVKEFIEQRTFYEDFLMFNDPYRSSWDDCTEEVMDILPLTPGSKVADVGTGFGYNAVRLKDKVGESGKVYATDTENNYIQYLSDFLSKNHIEGIEPIHTTSNSLGIADSLDMIFMSSLYHIIYTWSREDERKSFLSTVKENLKEGGYFVVVDNVSRHGDELNNCHVSPLLVEAQLGYWGFRPYQHKQLSDQRFLSIFVKDSTYAPEKTITTSNPKIVIDNQKSIVHIGSLDSYDITDKGIDAAQYVYDFLSSGEKSLANIAIEKYNDLIPQENFGGEYSALQWLCEAMIAPETEKQKMLSDRLSRSFYTTMTADSCKIPRYYLLHKYKLGNDSIRMLSDSILEMTGEVGRTHRSYLEDYILALNPKRPQWEKTDSLLARLGIQTGDTIADIGSGSGFFTDKFSSLVGNQGHVYALEIKDEHIKSLSDFLTGENIKNVSVIKGKEDELILPAPVDKMFMCSLYHIMYGVISDRDRDAYLKSLVKNLKDGGELIIVDNGPVDDDTLPYHGPYISKELIISQLSFYGFELVDYYQFIPQRYMLKFKLNK